jgi:hypothetical protein
MAAWWLEKKRSAVFYLKDRDINRQDRQRRYRIPGYFKRMFPSQFGIYLDKVFSTFRMAGGPFHTYNRPRAVCAQRFNTDFQRWSCHKTKCGPRRDNAGRTTIASI